MNLTFSHTVCVVLLTVSTVWDVFARRIPNGITIPAISGAIVFHGCYHGWLSGGWTAAAGCAVGGGLLLLPFAMGGIGGGDVKLMAALGAWLGGAAVVNVFIYSAWAGALWSLAVMIGDRSLIRRLRRIRQELTLSGTTGRLQLNMDKPLGIPYALPMAIGYLVFATYGPLV